MRAVSWSQFSALESGNSVRLIRQPAYGLYVSLSLVMFGFTALAELAVFDIARAIYLPPLLFIAALIIVLHPPIRAVVVSLERTSRTLTSGKRVWSEPFSLRCEIIDDKSKEEYSTKVFVSTSGSESLLFTVSEAKIGKALVDFARLAEIELRES